MVRFKVILKRGVQVLLAIFVCSLTVNSQLAIEQNISNAFNIDNFSIERASFGTYTDFNGDEIDVNEKTPNVILNRAYLCDEILVKCQLTCLMDSVADFGIWLTKRNEMQKNRINLPQYLTLSINNFVLACEAEQFTVNSTSSTSKYYWTECMQQNDIVINKGDKIYIEFYTDFLPYFNNSLNDWKAEKLNLYVSCLKNELYSNSKKEASIKVKSPLIEIQTFSNYPEKQERGFDLQLVSFAPDDFGQEKRDIFPTVNAVEFYGNTTNSWINFELTGIFNRDFNFYEDKGNNSFRIDFDQDAFWKWNEESYRLGSIKIIENRHVNTAEFAQIKLTGSFKNLNQLTNNYCEKLDKIVVPMYPNENYPLALKAVNGQQKIYISKRNQIINKQFVNTRNYSINTASLFSYGCQFNPDVKVNNQSQLLGLNNGFYYFDIENIDVKDTLNLSFSVQNGGLLKWWDKTPAKQLIKGLGNVNDKQMQLYVGIDTIEFLQPQPTLKVTQTNQQIKATISNKNASIYNIVYNIETDKVLNLIEIEPIIKLNNNKLNTFELTSSINEQNLGQNWIYSLSLNLILKENYDFEIKPDDVLELILNNVVSCKKITFQYQTADYKLMFYPPKTTETKYPSK